MEQCVSFRILLMGDVTTIHLIENGLGLRCDPFRKVSLFKFMSSWSVCSIYGYTFIFSSQSQIILPDTVFYCLFSPMFPSRGG